MKINPRERRLVIVTLALGVLYLGYNFAIKPQLAHQREVAAEVDQLEEQLASYKSSLKQKDAIEKRYGELNLGAAQAASLSRDEQTSRLLQDLRSRYARLGQPLTDKGTNVLAGEETPAHRKIRVSMNLEGTAVSLAAFMNDITTSRQPLRIEQIKLTAAGGEGGQEKVLGSMVVSAVYLQPVQ